MASAAIESATLSPNSEQVDLSTIPISPAGEISNGDSNPDSAEEVTVFHDKDNFNVKHPLMNKWTLWFTKPPSGKVSSWSQGVLAEYR
jgi:translation initiation factor 4E